MRLAKFAAVLAVLASPAAHAATFYVATSGNDANPGALTAPLRTIARAAQMTTPGDEVIVRGGVYTGKFTISAVGTAAARISIHSYPGEAAVIDGAGTAAGTDLVTFYQASYVDFSGFEVRNATRIGISLWGSKNVRIRNNEVHHSVRNGIYAGYASAGVSTDITVDGNDIHDNVLENQYHSMGGGGWAMAINVGMTTRGQITNNRVYRNQGEGIGSTQSNGMVIEHNEVFDNYSCEIYLDNAQSITVNGNFAYSTGNSQYFRDGYPATGIAMGNETYSYSLPLQNITVTNNIVVDGRWGFYYGAYENGGGMKNVTVANNTFYRGRQALIAIEADSHAGSVVQNNIFYQAGGAPIAAVVANGITYRSNEWYGGTPGTASGADDLYADPLFANAGGLHAADYKIASLSPAIHTGVDLSPVATDYFGSKRSPSYDRGAHESSISIGSGSVSAEPAAAPSDLRATSVSRTSVTLAWAASPSTVAGYKVYRNNGFVTNVDGTSWIDQNVSAGTTYTYEVLAFDIYGNPSAGSNVITVSTTPAPDTTNPTQPGSLTVTGVTATTVSLRWQASSDASGVKGYKIYRNGSFVTTVTGSTYDATALASGTSYTFHVTAVDASGNVSPASNAVTAKTLTTSKRRSAR